MKSKTKQLTPPKEEIHSVNKSSGQSLAVLLSNQAFQQLFPQCQVKLFRCDYIGNHKSHIPHQNTFPRVQTPESGPCQRQSESRKKKKNTNANQCRICNKCYSTGANLVIHMRTHTKERPYKCTACGKRCRQTGHVQKHIRTAHPNLPQTSYEIVRSSVDSNTMKFISRRMEMRVTKKLMKKKTKVAPIKKSIGRKNATKSSKTSKNPSKVRQEKGQKPSKSKSGQKSQCPKCNKILYNKWNLSVHMRIHNKQRPYRCLQCGSTARQLGNMQKHIRSIHPGKPLSFYEYTPDDKYPARANANSPVKTKKKDIGNDSTTIICRASTKRFGPGEAKEAPGSANSNSRRRNDSNTVKAVPRPHQCSQCEKSFFQRKALVVHMKRHSTPAPSKRTDVKTSTSTDLMSHKRFSTEDVKRSKQNVKINPKPKRNERGKLHKTKAKNDRGNLSEETENKEGSEASIRKAIEYPEKCGNQNDQNGSLCSPSKSILRAPRLNIYNLSKETGPEFEDNER